MVRKLKGLALILFGILLCLAKESLEVYFPILIMKRHVWGLAGLARRRGGAGYSAAGGRKNAIKITASFQHLE